MPDKTSGPVSIVQIGRFAHHLTGLVCIVLLCCLVFSEIAIVQLRYIYGIGFLQLQDFAAYSFAALVVLGIPYALAENAHVRVDVFRERQSAATRHAVDRAAAVLFLFPVFVLTLTSVWPDVLYAWLIREGSRETGGLPGLFIVKSALPLACVLMLLQGVLILIRKADKEVEAESK